MIRPWKASTLLSVFPNLSLDEYIPEQQVFKLGRRQVSSAVTTFKKTPSFTFYHLFHPFLFRSADSVEIGTEANEVSDESKYHSTALGSQ